VMTLDPAVLELGKIDAAARIQMLHVEVDDGSSFEILIGAGASLPEIYSAFGKLRKLPNTRESSAHSNATKSAWNPLSNEGRRAHPGGHLPLWTTPNSWEWVPNASLGLRAKLLNSR
jgi:hypothetical protein